MEKIDNKIIELKKKQDKNTRPQIPPQNTKHTVFQ